LIHDFRIAQNEYRICSAKPEGLAALSRGTTSQLAEECQSNRALYQSPPVEPTSEDEIGQALFSVFC
jgi:hypothetical protein